MTSYTKRCDQPTQMLLRAPVVKVQLVPRTHIFRIPGYGVDEICGLGAYAKPERGAVLQPEPTLNTGHGSFAKLAKREQRAVDDPGNAHIGRPFPGEPPLPFRAVQDADERGIRIRAFPAASSRILIFCLRSVHAGLQMFTAFIGRFLRSSVERAGEEHLAARSSSDGRTATGHEPTQCPHPKGDA